MKFLIFISVVIFTLIIREMMIQFIAHYKDYKEHKKKLSDFNLFIEKYKEYAKSIKDPYTSTLMLQDMSQLIVKFEYDQIDEMAEILDKKYQNYVPELKKNIRKKKLNQIFQ